MKQNPYVTRTGLIQRPRHKKGMYYSATACITISPGIKQGLVEIAESEGQSLSWIVSKVFNFYFGLKDDTPMRNIKNTKNYKGYKTTKIRKAG